jgi:hypothetical protein
VGEIELIEAEELLAEIVKTAAGEVWSALFRLTTITWMLPMALMSAFEMAAVICVGLTKAVWRDSPFQLTVEERSKFEPLTVSVNAGPPASTPEGESELIVGRDADAVLLKFAHPVVVKQPINNVTKQTRGFRPSVNINTSFKWNLRY